MVIDIFNTDNKYDIIYADPPWRQSKGGRKKARPLTSGTSLDYNVLSLAEIKEHLAIATVLIIVYYFYGQLKNIYTRPKN